MFRGYIR